MNAGAGVIFLEGMWMTTVSLSYPMNVEEATNDVGLSSDEICT